MKWLLLFFLIYSPIFSQDFSFLGLDIGMTSEEILVTISNNSYLIPSEDYLLMQLVPSTPYTLVLKGNDTNNMMIDKVFIDFFEKKSYQITIFLNSEYFSFYTLSEKLLDKYGTPTNRSSIKVTWYNTNLTYRLTLENPATIKITDFNILQKVLNYQKQQIEQGISESADYQQRQFILDEL